MLELIQPAAGLWRRAAYTFALYSPLPGVEGKWNKFRNVLAVAIYLKVNKMFIRRVRLYLSASLLSLQQVLISTWSEREHALWWKDNSKTDEIIGDRSTIYTAS